MEISPGPKFILSQLYYTTLDPSSQEKFFVLCKPNICLGVKFWAMSNFHVDGCAVKFARPSNFKPAAAAANQLSNFIAAANKLQHSSCKPMWRSQNLKKLQIYDIIKGWAYRPAQKF